MGLTKAGCSAFAGGRWPYGVLKQCGVNFGRNKEAETANFSLRDYAFFHPSGKGANGNAQQSRLCCHAVVTTHFFAVLGVLQIHVVLPIIIVTAHVYAAGGADLHMTVIVALHIRGPMIIIGTAGENLVIANEYRDLLAHAEMLGFQTRKKA